MANLNHQGLLASAGAGDAAKAAGGTTFSNTIENGTEQSFENKDGQKGKYSQQINSILTANAIVDGNEI